MPWWQPPPRRRNSLSRGPSSRHSPPLPPPQSEVREDLDFSYREVWLQMLPPKRRLLGEMRSRYGERPAPGRGWAAVPHEPLSLVPHSKKHCYITGQYTHKHAHTHTLTHTLTHTHTLMRSLEIEMSQNATCSSDTRSPLAFHSLSFSRLVFFFFKCCSKPTK